MARQGSNYKPTEDDRNFARRASMAGLNQEVIAETLNITAKTLRKHYRYELTTARNLLIAGAAHCLSDAVDNGNVDAAKYILSRQAGWTERHEVTGADGGPIEQQTTIDASGLSDAALAEIMGARRDGGA